MSSDNPFMNRGASQPPSAAISGGGGQSAPRPGTVSGAPSAGRSSRQLSPLPTVMAAVLIVISMGLAVIVLRGMNSDVTLPFATAGYVLTPFLTAACLIWARALDLRGQGDPTYLRADGQRRLKFLGVLVLVSFAPSLAFIWYIASYVGSVIA